MASKKSVFNYAPSFYGPGGIQWADAADYRAEYSRLRSIAQKRLERIKGTEFEHSAIFQQNQDGFLTVRQAASKGVLAEEMAALRSFLSDDLSTLKGARARKEKTLSTLHERGYSFVTSDNYWDYTRFMEWANMVVGSTQFSSEFVNDFIEKVVNSNPSATFDNMKRWFTNWLKANDETEMRRNAKAYNADYYRQ